MDNENDDKKKKRKQILLMLLIIILVIHLVLVLSRCTVARVENEVALVPYNETRYFEKPMQSCSDAEYYWDYEWRGWENAGPGKVTPIFRITNLEDMPGTFRINFAFFDESQHHYKDYEGILYALVKEKLPWNAASMTVDNVEQYLGSGKSVTLFPSAEKLNPDAVYWAYADVHPPIYQNCTTFLENTTQDVLMYRNQTISKKVSRTASLWELLVERIVG